jgi:signal transduction histidine kinase
VSPIPAHPSDPTPPAASLPVLVLRILLFNQFLALVLLLVAASVAGVGRVPLLWGPIFVSTNAVGGCIQVLVHLVLGSRLEDAAGAGGRHLLMAGVVLAGTAAGVGLSILVLRALHPGTGLPLRDLASFFAFSLLFAAIVSTLRFLYAGLKARIEQKAIEVQQLRELEARTRLMALQAKVNPHFLFNTLNTMLNLVGKAPGELEDLILDLSDLYRRVLLVPERGLHPLSEELELVGRYLAIEQVRLGRRLAFQFSVEPAAAARELPPMLVEPLVENAVKHGIGSRPEGGLIRIVAWDTPQAVHIRVEDDGTGEGAGAASTGFGLYGIRERLRLTYGDRAALVVEALPGRGFRVELKVPHGH